MAATAFSTRFQSAADILNGSPELTLPAIASSRVLEMRKMRNHTRDTRTQHVAA